MSEQRLSPRDIEVEPWAEFGAFPSPFPEEVRQPAFASLFTTRARHAHDRCLYPDPTDRALVACGPLGLTTLPAPAVEVSTEHDLSRTWMLSTCALDCNRPEHACALLEDGRVACWGARNVGQVGDGTQALDPRLTPHVVEGLPRIVDIDAAAQHTCAVGEDGSVWCWGSNYMGQLGEGSETARDRPARVLGLDARAVAVELGPDHSCALLDDGGAACWGRAISFGLLDGERVAQRLPHAHHVVALLAIEDLTCVVERGGGGSCGGRMSVPGDARARGREYLRHLGLEPAF